MTKKEYAKANGIKVRKATSKDKQYAHSDYAKKANYIITTRTGKAFWSTKGTLNDMKYAKSRE